METQEKTCEERIANQLAGRVEDLELLTDCPSEEDRAEWVVKFNASWGLALAPDDSEGTISEAQYQAAAEWPLEIDAGFGRPVKILLSTGGPADWFEIAVDDDGEPLRGDYVFQDWCDGARLPLDKDTLAMLDQLYGEVWRSNLTT